MKKETSLETIAVHAGLAVDPSTGALNPPIHLTTTFERDPDGEYSRGYVYTRSDNPNRRALEESLTALEAGAGAITFGSGMAASSAMLMALQPGDHLILPDDCYFQVRLAVKNIFTPWGLKASIVDLSDLKALEAALTPETKLIWMETPSNPQLKVTDIQAVVELAKSRGAYTICDNTWGTAVLQRPLELGVDVSLHSTTKYIAGHHDVLGGALVFREKGELQDKLRTIQKVIGAVPSPFDCWLTLRGIQTLPMRVKTQTRTTAQVAEFLAGHPKVEQVNYPGLAGHPGHEAAKRQMSGFGAMLSFQVKGGQDQALAVAGGVEMIIRATSLGGTHTLIEHRASIEGPDSPTPRNLLRLSIGLENPADIIEDLEKGLAVI